MSEARLSSLSQMFRAVSEVARAGLHCGLAASLVSGCAAEGPAFRLVASELASPAQEGSGEPFLSSSGDTVYMSWLEAVAGGAHELRFARFAAGAWDEPALVASSDAFFVNWADIPSVSPGTDASLWAHWLERGPNGGTDYGVRISRSTDRGVTWSEPWIPHEDGTPTDHGFVSFVEMEGARGFLWLDGRRYHAGAAGARDGPVRETSLYFRAAGAHGPSGPEVLVDPRVCDCCQTDVVSTVAGPVAAYRDRSPDEIRDIRVARYRNGTWSEGPIVYEDGWETAACPVNGPAVAARREEVVVAWFTAAGGVPRVKVAFSDDDAESFGAPVVVDDGNPAGRVDVVMLEDGAALVSWLERTGGERADVRLRRVESGGRRGESVSVSAPTSERASGLPRLTPGGAGWAMVAWTDATEITPRVRVARVDLENETRTREES